jgi:glyoxylase-like metal-dependent hydrolase (beta-lactamase superfamily II)
MLAHARGRAVTQHAAEPPPAGTGAATRLTARIRRLVATNAGPLTGRGTNTYLVAGDALAVIDPGPADSAHLEATLAAIGAAPVAAILVTHHHADHLGNAAALAAATGAPILRGGLPDAAEANTRRLADGERIDLGGAVLDAVATPGHTADHFCFALADEAVLFSGDHVMAWSTSVVIPPDGSMAAYRASLARIAARPERLYLPGHGETIGDGAARAGALLAHRQEREEAILRRLAAGDRHVGDIVRHVYAGIAPALEGAAAFSVLAHLIELTDRGAVASDRPPSLLAAYRIA